MFEYLDYRKFLQDFADHKRKTDQFRVAEFAKAAGFGSTSYWKMIVTGERNLSRDSSESVANAFHLRNEEARFFCELVAFNQESDLQEKSRLYRELLKFRRFRERNPEIKDQYAYYEHWFIPAIFEALQTPWADLSADDQAASLGLRRDQLDRAFEILKALKLVQKEKKTLKVTQATLSTPAELQNVNLRNFHRQMILKGLTALDQLNSKERYIGALTLAMSEKKFELARERIYQFLQDMNVICSSPNDAENIYQLNFQLFPTLNEGLGLLHHTKERKNIK